MIFHIIVEIVLLGLWMIENEPLYLVVFGLCELYEVLNRINDNIKTSGEKSNKSYQGGSSMLSSPCKDCVGREIGCHGKCEYYKKFCEDMKEYAKKKRQHDMIENSRVDSTIRVRDSHGRGNRKKWLSYRKNAKEDVK